MMKRQAFTKWRMVLILVGLATLLVVLYPVFSRARAIGRRSTCYTNLNHIRIAISQYTRDYDETYPLLNSGEKGWMDIIQPYIKDTRPFQCPADRASYADGTTDYFFNPRVAGQPESKLANVWSTIMTGDGIGNSPTNTGLVKLPLGWKNNLKSPAFRHLEGANYGFVAGHVKWLKPAQVTGAKPSSSVYTFAPR